MADIWRSLTEGFDDFKARPSHVFFLCVIYPLFALVLTVFLVSDTLLYLAFPVVAGFTLLGPVVSVGLTSGDGAPALALEQRRFFSDPDARESGAPTRWLIPMVVRYRDDDGVKEERVLLSEAAANVPLSAKGTPRWLTANAEAAGFYRCAYDEQLLASLGRAAGELAGCDHHTVVLWVARRDAGELTATVVRRPQLIDEFLAKLEEWMDASRGKIRADVAHDKLLAMGYTGSERTTRRAVAAARRAWQAGHRRVHRPWVPEPGLWFQWDFGDGPTVAGVKAVLFCAWLSWSRFRVVLPIRDKSLSTVVACIDATLRRFGGCPTYALTDNEKTVTVEHVARIAIRNPDMVAAAGHYGLTVATCLPADAPSKGGSEATVRVAKADLVPTDANLLDAYADWQALEDACAALCEQINARVHRVTRRAPAPFASPLARWTARR